MADKVIVRQNNQLSMEVFAVDPQIGETDEYWPVDHPFDVTPHGMLLISLGSCTCIMMHSYAANRGIDLQEVEVRLAYVHEGVQHVEVAIGFRGDFDEDVYQRLYNISRHCSVHEVLQRGVPIDWADLNAEG